MDAAHGAFENVVLFLQPGEEAGDIAPHIVYCHLAAVSQCLVVDQVAADFLGTQAAQRGADTAAGIPRSVSAFSLPHFLPDFSAALPAAFSSAARSGTLTSR